MRILLILLAFGAPMLLAGCATPSANSLANDDPYEATNREIFAFNLKVDRWTLRRAAEFYNDRLPETVRDSVHNVIVNLDLPVTFVNDTLQARPKRAGQTVGRFVINSTVGLGGLFDVAGRIGIPEHSSDFGQTLGIWGVGEGPYLVLPILGPAPPRDAVGQAVDVFFDPSIYVHMKQHMWWMMGREYVKLVDIRARNLQALDDIERDSLDFYAATRSLYRQYRNHKIEEGNPSGAQETNPPATNLP